MGASDLGYTCCKAVIDAGNEVVGIFTIPQNFSIKYKDQKDRVTVNNYLFRDFKDFETDNRKVIIVEDKMSTYLEQLKNLKPDLILVIGWYFMIPDQMIQLAVKGTIGIHGSLLPKYRGNAPFVWAMINGESETGISLFYFEKGVDEGDIIAQEKFPIVETDTILNILEKAKKASVKLLIDYLPRIADGTAPKIPQDHSQATIFPKRTPEDGLIDWNWDAKKIRNFIKAQTRPYPGAFTIINKKKIILWDADIIDE